MDRAPGSPDDCPAGLTSGITSPAPVHLVYILGISRRSGTTFLKDLLRVHPQCEGCGPLREDFFLYEAQSLADYVDRVHRRWRPKGLLDERFKGLMYESLGNAVTEFMAGLTDAKWIEGMVSRFPGATEFARSDRPRWLVTKTPSVRNLHIFERLFPRSSALIMIRDGRSAVESGVIGFGWTYEWAVRQWAEAAESIRAVLQQHEDRPSRLLAVKYEDLLDDLEGTLEEILTFVGMDTASYDFQAARNLPVRGSSMLRGDATAPDGSTRPVHWQPVQKAPDFDPRRRWSHWTRRRHERFNWIAGDVMKEFGYPLQTYGGPRLPWTLYNVALDLKWKLRSPLVRRLLRKLEQVLRDLSPQW